MMNMIYSTKDFYLACLLKSKDYKLISTQKHSEKNTVFFNFEYIKDKEQDLRQLVDNFINMTIETNVRKFTWAMKDLRKELDKFKNKN